MARLTVFASHLLVFSWVAALSGPPGFAQERAAPSGETIGFASDIRPLLSDKCFQCHGPDANSREADLRLDDREQALRVLVGADGEPPELLARIESDDPDVRMPPPESKNALTPKERQLLREWVLAGAEYERHWAFRPIVRPELPELDARSKSWARSPIDVFVRHRLDALGATPLPEASRRRWLRRVSMDLTGLPPSPEDIADFLADDRPNPQARVVDRLLASPHFGERLAAAWLDVARYSDTYGYQVDRERYVWPWRDWVIQALNTNQPFDEFVIEQLAGDLLPNPSSSQMLATTFNRLHPQKVEGGSVPEEFRVEYVADRNHTFGSAFLGLTLECCRCHDHKYDPLSQREYYQLFAYFNNIDEAGLYSYFTNSVPTPTLTLENDDQRERLAQAEQRVRRAESALTPNKEQLASYREWFAALEGGQPPLELDRGLAAKLDFEEGGAGANRVVDGPQGKAAELTGDDEIAVKAGAFSRSQAFSVSLRTRIPQPMERAVIFHRSRAWTDAASRGYELLLEDGRLSFALIHFWPGNAIRIRATDPAPVGEWAHVAVTYDGSSRAAGMRVFLNGEPAEVEVVRDQLRKNITGGGHDQIGIGARFRDRGFTNGQVDDFRVYDRRLSSVEVAKLAGVDREFGEPEWLEHYLWTVDARHGELRKQLGDARRNYFKLQDGLREIMVMREMEQTRPTHLLGRGAYDAPGEAVAAATPAFLPQPPSNAPRNRLGLAQWLTDQSNPLFARVIVNRFWAMCFGRGLVATPEDFGSQGAAPTHPQLLDWLADDFRRNHYDVKRLFRQITLSAAYRQDSTPQSPDQREAWAKWVQRDPQNQWLSRGPSHQWPAELLRDQALSASGLLSRRFGGPPARPYELAASFKPIAPDKGEGLYRRSVYTYWKRTAPAPVMMTLDAAKRDVCTVRRERTSSPLQSLVLLNDPQMIEASRVLAARLLDEFPVPEVVIEKAFVRLTGRPPSDQERQVLLQLWQDQRRHFLANLGDAQALLSVGEAQVKSARSEPTVAAATIVVSTILNHDACVVKR